MEIFIFDTINGVDIRLYSILDTIIFVAHFICLITALLLKLTKELKIIRDKELKEVRVGYTIY
jgi:hypothetical protein